MRLFTKQCLSCQSDCRKSVTWQPTESQSRSYPRQSWVQLHTITSITITLKYRPQLQLQLHHHNVILNYNYNYTMFISITITVPFLRKWYFFMMEYWVNRFWVVFQFWPEQCLVTLPPLSLPTLFGSIISRHLISYMCGTSELDHTM